MVFPLHMPDLSALVIRLFDPVSLSIKRLPVDTLSGFNSVAWTDNGRIVFPGVPVKSSICRFRPETGSAR
jgi:hypothetical protein